MQGVFECTPRVSYALVHSGLQSVIPLIEIPPGLTGRISISGFTPRGRALQVGSGFHTNISPELDPKCCSDISVPITASVIVDVSNGEKIVRQTQILPLCAWDQRREFAPATAAFVLENDPLAFYTLRRAGIGPSPSGERRPIKEKIRALFEQQSRSLLFCYLFERGLLPSGEQLIRFPRQMHADRGGTCVDLTLLAAGICRAAGLNPVVIILGEENGYRRHALIGAWAETRESATSILDKQSVEDAIRNEQLLVWESTSITQEEPRFEDAIAEAFRIVGHLPVLWAVDISASRRGPQLVAALQAEAVSYIPPGPDPIPDPMTKTRSAEATEVLKKLRVEIVTNGRAGDIVDAEGRRAFNIRIGKAPWNHVVLAHSSVSREHAVAFVRNGVIYITDLGSIHGTRVGDTLLEPYSSKALANGASVRLGDVELRIRYA